MKVKFSIEGEVGLNYGIDGTIKVKKGEIKELSEKHALILNKCGLASLVVSEEKPAKVEAEKAPEPKAEEKEEKPKRRGRPAKKKDD